MAFDLNNTFGIKKAIKYLLGKTKTNTDNITTVTNTVDNITTTDGLFTEELIIIDETLTGLSNIPLFTRTLAEDDIIRITLKGVFYQVGAAQTGVFFTKGGGHRFGSDSALGINLAADFGSNPTIGTTPIFDFAESGNDVILQVNPNNNFNNIRFLGKLTILTYNRSL